MDRTRRRDSVEAGVDDGSEPTRGQQFAAVRGSALSVAAPHPTGAGRLMRADR
jgi:hypothetical protein